MVLEFQRIWIRLQLRCVSSYLRLWWPSGFGNGINLGEVAVTTSLPECV